MANSLPIKKSFAALLSFLVLFGTVGPSGLAFQVPTAKAAVIDVSNLNDAGAGSLRQAISDANLSVGVPDTITFSVAGTINLQAPDLPGITDPLILDATSTLQAGPNIVLNAAGRTVGLMFNNGTGNGVYGISVTGAQNCFGINVGVTGINLGSSAAEGGIEATSCTNRGFDIAGASNVVIVNASILSNASGIVINNNASNVTIGGTTAGERVIVAGSTQNGIWVNGGSNITIKGSYIGVDKNGNTQANGQNGILVDNLGATNVVLGGSTAGERNILSGNNQYGVSVQSNAVTIKGNYIGTDPTGLLARANGQGGIRIEANNVTVGGATSAERNVIAGNSMRGISADSNSGARNGGTIQNNYIGQTADGSATLANGGDGIIFNGTNTIQNFTISQNLISGNTGTGINLMKGTNNTIIGNIIGLAFDGTVKRANGQNGITLAFGAGTGNNFVGQANTPSSINYISGNSQAAIQIQGNSNTILDNCIGTNLSCASDATLRNTAHAIQFMNGASSNIIGGDATGAANTIHPNNGQMAIMVGNNAGSNDNFNHNNFQDRAPGGTFTSVTPTGNESITTPTLTSVIRISPTVVEVTGNTLANYRVDVFAGGLWAGTGTANGSGIFSIQVTSVATNYTVMATSGTGSTSGTPTIVLETPDTTPPDAPTATATPNPASAGSTVVISGTGEKNANVYSNGIDTGVDVDSSQNYSFNVTALAGSNNVQVTLVDGMSNVSAGVAADFTATDSSSNDSGGGGGGASAAGAGAAAGSNSNQEEPETGNIVDPDTQTVLDPVEEAPLEGTESIAGEEEVVETPEENTPTGSSEPQSTPPPATEPPPSAIKPPVKPIKSFVVVINEVAQPIKVKTIRETLPEVPKIETKFTKTLIKTEVFGPSNNSYGVPDQIVTIKQNLYNNQNTNLDLDSDGDGLTDGEEYSFFTDPTSSDTDRDGVDDVHEVFETGTDPSLYDSDRDGLADTLDLDPLVYNNPEENVTPEEVAAYIAEEEVLEPGLTDSDEDGLCDLLELRLGTDPQNADSDEDGKTDGNEYLQHGTDPLVETSDSQVGGLRFTNAVDKEVVSGGTQFYMGQGPAETEISLYEIDANGELILVGKTTADETNRFNILTELKAGTHTLVAIAGDPENPVDISAPFTVTTVNYTSKPEYVSLSLKNGSEITDLQPTLSLKGEDMIIVSWKSTINNQVLIADASGETIYSKPVENLELGDHTVTWYAVDSETNQKSEPTQVAFTITNAAFVTGENASNLWTIILGSIAVLASLTSLGLYFRKGKVSR